MDRAKPAQGGGEIYDFQLIQINFNLLISIFDVDSASKLISNLRTCGFQESESLLKEGWQEDLATLPDAQGEISYFNDQKHYDVLIWSSQE